MTPSPDPAAETAETRWWLVRHAPVPDPEGRIVGASDPDAHTGDVEELEALARSLPPHAVLLTTPLRRTGQTARALAAAGLRVPRAVEDPDLREQSFGAWEGRTWGALASREPPEPGLAAFWADPAHRAPPEGESFADVVARVRAALERHSTTYAGRDIIAVVHAGSIRAALAVALDLDPAVALRFAVAPLSLTRLDRLAGGAWAGWRVGGVNTLMTP
ncbi:histidine phosphatase family protein [Roseospira marina]|uniref:Histidine phosphatase family protein n=1 Tax=Roseospira marina TaxID=140057 RepID=A0A5M6IBT3_9PROT|nr:histidine phosphatase family protein [Roseospira marina]KAA5605750.1 histidine phosphatase family protein [Roseospira marina]MBB4313553.1 alpha-ribazole phosphatase [Roseospira marina]MBB5086715.1 alpha-ribazole phosphatase [Roseospira marina]